MDTKHLPFICGNFNVETSNNFAHNVHNSFRFTRVRKKKEEECIVSKTHYISNLPSTENAVLVYGHTGITHYPSKIKQGLVFNLFDEVFLIPFSQL